MEIWYQRYHEGNILQYLSKGKVLLIYGPRRSGKTSLILKLLSTYKEKYFLGSGDDMPLRELFASESISKIQSAFKGYDLIVLDEAQKIRNVGVGLKIIVDHLPDVKVIASGSSSFKLSSEIGEPLTGRHRKILIFPLAIIELASQLGRIEILNNLENYLIYGSYPEVLTADAITDKKEYLVTLRDSYLFKDILELENLRNSDKLTDLLKLIAFQIGNEVSLNELSNNLQIAKQTVDRYLELLEKNFIIKKVKGFSRNLRKEVSKTARYYFFDNGIRNAMISNFNTLKNRDDVGMLWENFLFIERMKKLNYIREFPNVYFWRTHDRKEIDLVEEKDGKLSGFEFKWGLKKTKIPKLWFDTYSNSSAEIINRDNFLDFIC